MNPQTWPSKLLVIDVEGNGAQPPDLVEFAAVPILVGHVTPGDSWSTLVRPATAIRPMATRIHGISNHDVQNAPTWADIAPQVRALLEGAWIAAHNAGVEYALLTRLDPGWKPAGVIDTLKLSRHVFGKSTRHNLDALITHTGIDTSHIPGQRHRAAFDAHATALLLANLAEHFPTFADLAAAAAPIGIPTGMPADVTLAVPDATSGAVAAATEETLW